MDATALAIALAVAAVAGLLWRAMHASPHREDFIDHRADEAFRKRTARRLDR